MGEQESPVYTIRKGELQGSLLSLEQLKHHQTGDNQITASFDRMGYWPNSIVPQMMEPRPSSTIHREGSSKECFSTLSPRTYSYKKSDEDTPEPLLLRRNGSSSTSSTSNPACDPKPDKNIKLSVRFSQITIRVYYEKMIGDDDDQCCNSISKRESLHSDYAYNIEKTVSLNEYEKNRPKRRTLSELQAPSCTSEISPEFILQCARASKRSMRKKNVKASKEGPSTKFLKATITLFKKIFTVSDKKKTDSSNTISITRPSGKYQHY